MPDPVSGADPVARHSRLIYWGFMHSLRWQVARVFHGVRLAREHLPAPAANARVIVYSNHPSWWDPALYYLLNARVFPGRVGYAPIEAAALGKYGVLGRVGAFGITHDRAGAVRFLATAEHILASPRRVLWINAEGHFRDSRARPVRLERGLAHLLRRVPDATVHPLALDYVFWNESKPEALAAFGPPVFAGGTPSETHARLESSLEAEMDRLATLAAGREAAPFLDVQRGSAGVGGVYDWWRRGRSWAIGRRFDPGHEA